MSFQPRDPHYKEKVQAGFAQQAFMPFIGAEVAEVQPGYCEIRLPYKPELMQQHGLFHGGVVGTLADNAGAGATGTLVAEGNTLLTVEYKLNFLSPAQGEMLIARGQVLKAGRTLTVARSDVYAVNDGVEKLCATALTTVMTIPATAI